MSQLTRLDQYLKKDWKYLSPEEEPPKGAATKTGPKGGKYYWEVPEQEDTEANELDLPLSAIRKKVSKILNAYWKESIDWKDTGEKLAQMGLTSRELNEIFLESKNWADIKQRIIKKLHQKAGKQKDSEAEKGLEKKILDIFDQFRTDKVDWTSTEGELLSMGFTYEEIDTAIKGSQNWDERLQRLVEIGKHKDIKIDENLETKEEVDWMQRLAKIGEAKGTTKGGQYTDAFTGKEYYLKILEHERALVEDVASSLYQLAGVSIIPREIIKFGDSTAIKSDYMSDLQMVADPVLLSDMGEIKRNFVIDAWLANWDVIGLKNNNVGYNPRNGITMRVDPGGSLYIRAQGGSKIFENTVPELKTMRDPKISPQAGKVFKNLSNEAIQDGLGRLSSITDEMIDGVINSAGLSNYNSKIADTLKARRDYILDYYKDISKLREKKPCSPGFHRHEKYDYCHPINQVHRGEKDFGRRESIDRYLSKHKNPKIREIYAKANKLFDEIGIGNREDNNRALEEIASELDIMTQYQINDQALERWQSGKSSHGQISIRAAISELSGKSQQQYASENAYFVYAKEEKPAMFQERFTMGTENAIGLIPFIVLGRKALLKKYPNGIIPNIYRGVTGEMADRIRATLDKAEEEDQIGIPHDGSSSYSLNRETAANLGRVILRKRNVSIDNVWVYFNSFSSDYDREEEIIVDSSATNLFMKYEIEGL